MSQSAITPNRAPARDVLTQADAAGRAGRVHRASYDIRLELVAGEPSYRGDVTIHFAAIGDEPLFLDFRGREIERLEINGQLLEPDWTGYRLFLPADRFGGETSVRLVYRNDYDTTGDGFHRFVDPEDGAEYVYTNFEPYEAHRLIPCFDQPDIKGVYRLTVSAPADWQVVANSPAAEASELADNHRLHRFAESELFSTYLLALIGGPYAVRRLQHGAISLGLYARRSMERQLDEHAAEIFELTGQGMDFYAGLFAQAYPFAKYDQLFVPEYNSGAMENVGAVTYNESYLFRDPPTENQRLDRGEVLLHELAHMWFGNLVTMRWWDDLWLNESFATYVSYLALTEATRFANAWKVFNADIKRWAYQQDQLVTTHPIAGAAADTEQAFLNFDGITYGKGASVLKQLARTIGADGFREGLRLYFRRYAWSNATLADFLACLHEASGQPLEAWARLWLETASLNTLAAEWRADDGRLSELILRQAAPPDHPTLRPHALEIGLGNEVGGRLEVTAVPARIDADAEQALVPAARGLAAPAFVFPNHGDHAYAKVALDDRTLGYVRGGLDRIADDLLRQLVWMSLWEMVRDCQLSSTDFLAICRDALSDEPDLDIVDSVLERVGIVLARYVAEPSRPAQARASFASALDNLRRAGDSDRQILWTRAAIAAADDAQSVAELIRAVDGGGVAGFEFDQEMRWAIATKAIAFGLPGAEARLTVEEARDRSDRGVRALIKAHAARPTAEAKRVAWRRIHGEGYGSFHLTRAAMQGFFWPNQSDLLAPYEALFFDQVQGIFDAQDHPFARAYVLNLFPAYRADPAVLDRAQALLAALDGAQPTLSRQLAEASDELARAIRVRAFAER